MHHSCRSALRFCRVWLIGACGLAALDAAADPAFTMSLTGELSAQIGADDAGHYVGAVYAPETESGLPETVTQSAYLNNAGTITTSLTSQAPYILDNQYWAGTWDFAISAEAGAGGRFGTTYVDVLKSFIVFSAPGLQPYPSYEYNHTTFYYAAKWNVEPADSGGVSFGFRVSSGDGLGRQLYSPTLGLTATSGSFSGSGTGEGLHGLGLVFGTGDTPDPGVLPMNPDATASASFSIAYSLTPIDASVFDAPASVPDAGAGTLLLSTIGFLGLALVRPGKSAREGGGQRPET